MNSEICFSWSILARAVRRISIVYMYDFLCENVDTPVLVVVLFKCLICLLALVSRLSLYALAAWLHGREWYFDHSPKPFLGAYFSALLIIVSKSCLRA